MKWHLAVQVVKNKNLYISISFTSHTVETMQPSGAFEDVSLYTLLSLALKVITSLN